MHVQGVDRIPRGADDRAFDKFERIWTDHTVIPLTENYRSEPAILNGVTLFEVLTDLKVHRLKDTEMNPRTRRMNGNRRNASMFSTRL